MYPGICTSPTLASTTGRALLTWRLTWRSLSSRASMCCCAPGLTSAPSGTLADSPGGLPPARQAQLRPLSVMSPFTLELLHCILKSFVDTEPTKPQIQSLSFSELPHLCQVCPPEKDDKQNPCQAYYCTISSLQDYIHIHRASVPRWTLVHGSESFVHAGDWPWQH